MPALTDGETMVAESAAIVQKIADVKIPSSQAGWGDFDRVFDVIDETLAAGGPAQR